MLPVVFHRRNRMTDFVIWVAQMFAKLAEVIQAGLDNGTVG